MPNPPVQRASGTDGDDSLLNAGHGRARLTAALQDLAAPVTEDSEAAEVERRGLKDELHP